MDPVRDQYRRFTELEAGLDAIKKLGIKTERADNFFSRAARFNLGPQFILRGLDRRHGSELEVIQGNLSEKLNRLGFKERLENKNIQAVDELISKSGLKQEEFYKLLESPTAPAGFLNKEGQEALIKAREFFDRAREEAKQLGVPIEKRAFYVPHKTVDPLTYSRKLIERERELGGIP